MNDNVGWSCETYKTLIFAICNSNYEIQFLLWVMRFERADESRGNFKTYSYLSAPYGIAMLPQNKELSKIQKCFHFKNYKFQTMTSELYTPHCGFLVHLLVTLRVPKPFQLCY